MKTLILGFGISGRKAAEFLLNRGEKILCVDKRSELLKKDQTLSSFPIVSESEKMDWGKIHRLIKSPGVDPSHPIVQEAHRRSIPVLGEIDLALEALTLKKKILIGITGSNGKTTTTLLLSHLLKDRSIAVGNVGLPLIGEVDHSAEIFIVELSSFQLESILPIQAFDAGVILNITPNHLNRYKSFEEYAAAKWQLQKCLKKEGALFIQRKAFEEFQQFSYPMSQFKFFESCTEKVETILSLSYRDGRFWPARHDFENLSAAYAICHMLGVTDEQFVEGVHSFRKPPHRIEFVREFQGVTYVNDSKASSVDAVLKGVDAMSGNVILIAGGVDKGGSFLEWALHFKTKVKAVLAMGEAAFRIQKELEGMIPVSIVSSLNEGVYQAYQLARSGETVLLSPGCSSYDQFKDFQERGEIFKELVFALGEKKT